MDAVANNEIVLEYTPGRGYKVTQIVGYFDGYHLMIYSKKGAGDVARMGGWKRSDVVKVWTPLHEGWMPAYASVRGDGKQTLIFLATNFTTREFPVREMPIARPVHN